LLGTLEYEGDADTLLTDSVVTGLRLPGATASFAVRKVDVEGASVSPLMHRVMCQRPRVSSSAIKKSDVCAASLGSGPRGGEHAGAGWSREACCVISKHVPLLL
jgi:hypothetical protein